jgi:hypothetical protein
LIAQPERRFYFRLCLALGYQHPDVLLSQLTSRQITEWIAYSQLEPFGERNRDLYFGKVVEMLVKMFGGDKHKKVRASDFLDTSRLDYNRRLLSCKRMKKGAIKDFFKTLKDMQGDGK